MSIGAKPRGTCAGCVNLTRQATGMHGVIHYCAATQAVVPHEWESSHPNGWEATFWRVPTNCPLPDTEVRKSDKKAPRAEWVIVREGQRP